MKKAVLLSISTIIFISLFAVSTNANIGKVAPAKVGVLIYDESVYFYSLIRDDLLKLEKESQGREELIFYNAENNQELQNKQLDELINMKVNLIVLSIVEPDSYNSVIEKIKQSGIPVIFLGRGPRDFNILKTYPKSIYIGSDACQSGIIQGQMIINELKNKQIIDRTKTNRLDYFLLKGSLNDIATNVRSNCVINELERNGIVFREVASEYCNWRRECAQEKIRGFLKTRKNDIDLIIANNDEMAIGAVLALQEIGYNTGNPEKYIPVVGVDGTDLAIELIERGEMAGTVIQDHEAMSNAVYRTGMNMIRGREPIEGTDFKYQTNQVIIIPYNGYVTRKLL